MEIVLCVKDNKKDYRVTAFGTLDIPEENDLDQYIGRALSFTAEREFGDVKPLVVYRPKGIMSRTDSRKFYEFEVISGTGNSGQLKVLAVSKEQGCLPANAP